MIKERLVMSHWQHLVSLTLKYTTIVIYMFKISFKYNLKQGSEGGLCWIFLVFTSFPSLNLSPKYDEHHPRHFVSENFQERYITEKLPNQTECKPGYCVKGLR